MNEDAPSLATKPLLKCLLSGLDSLYVSYYLDIANSALDLDELAFQKERVREARRGEIAEMQLGTERFAVMPYGKHPYTYVLSNEAFEVRLGERMSPSCHVQFKSEYLWTCGLDDLVKRFEGWCDALNLKRKLPEVVARADWAFDYPLASFDFNADDFVTRFRKDAIYRENRQVQTFTIGKGDVVIRVYDKIAEVREESKKFWFFPLWGQQEDVCRVEFQVRRARLAEAGIDTIADLRELQNDLLRELANNHTTLRRPNGDTNRARWPLHPLWTALIGDIDALPQTGLIRSIDPRGTLTMRIYEQARSLHGSLKGLCALLSEQDGRTSPMTLPELLSALPAVLRTHHNEVVWQTDVSRRLTALRLGQW